jgi:hypothetical protein
MAGKGKVAKKSESSSVASSRKQSVDEKESKKKLVKDKQDFVKATKKEPLAKGKGKVIESSSDDSDDSDEDVKKKPVVGQKRPRATSAASDASTKKA